MAHYSVYGYAAYEVEVDNHIEQKVIFAISMAHRPQWLSWYFYTQDMSDLWVNDFRKYAADRTKRIGKMRHGGPATPFSYSPQINVNAFVDPGPFVAAGYMMWDHGSTFDCGISLVIPQKPIATFYFKLDWDNPMRGAVMNKFGTVWLMGSVNVSKSSIISELKKGWPKGIYPLSTDF